MTLLTPLGLLGLLGLVVWLIIYIIKPNYQQKIISSTYIWKLSLKYRKRKIPLNKLRNLLLILCQILILTASAMILARPAQVIKATEYGQEVVAIIDASASMFAETDGKTRFEKAVNNAIELSEATFSNGGAVSVILANGKSSLLVSRLDSEAKDEVLDTLEGLLETETGYIACSYGTTDIAGAFTLTEEILVENPSADVYFYTDTAYETVPSDVQVVNVSSNEEWNVAVLNAYTEMEDNFYTFNVDVACYGRDSEVEVTLVVQNPNGQDDQFVFTQTVLCMNDMTARVVFINADLYQGSEENESDRVFYYLINSDERVYSYSSVSISLNTSDSLTMDNNFYLYDGVKPTIKIQYVSNDPCDYLAGLLDVFRMNLSNQWTIEVTEVAPGKEAATEGFDFYLYENSTVEGVGESPIPEFLPTDGIVFLINPDFAPTGSDLMVEREEIVFKPQTVSLSGGDAHEILNNINADEILISKYRPIWVAEDSGYKELMYCDGENPVMFVKDTPEEKIIVLGFDIHFSDQPGSPSWPTLFYNIFQRFLPSTVEKNSFEVDEAIKLNARGQTLEVRTGGNTLITYTEFPTTYVVTNPGTYTLVQETMRGEEVVENIFVRIPIDESNVRAIAENLPEIERPAQGEDTYFDFLLYLAAAIVLLLLIEWLLQAREYL